MLDWRSREHHISLRPGSHVLQVVPAVNKVFVLWEDGTTAIVQLDFMSRPRVITFFEVACFETNGHLAILCRLGGR